MQEGTYLTPAGPAPGNNTVLYLSTGSLVKGMNQPCSLRRGLTEALLNHRLRGHLFTLLVLWEGGIAIAEEFCSVLRGFTIPEQLEMAKEPRFVKLKD